MRRTAAMAALVLLTAAIVCSAAPDGKKPKPKSPPKPQATRGVKGTTQMAGDNGKMGVTYTIGNGADAINFTLVSAEYSISRIVIPGRLFVPKAEEKCLVLHYTLHNPNPREMTVNGFTLNFTAVDSKDINRSFGGREGILSVKEGANEGVGLALKPAQKIALRSAVILPADATVPKLIVQRAQQQPVERIYFKPGEIKPIAEAYRDPADSSGCTSLASVPGKMDTYYEGAHFDVKLVGTSYASEKLGGYALRRGMRNFVATITVKGQDLRPWTLNGFTFKTGVKTNDGEKSRMLSNQLLKTQRDESVGMQLGPGEEYTARIVIQVPVDATVTEFYVQDLETQRTYVFPIQSP